MNTRRWWSAVSVAMLVLGTTPVFFESYRTAAFNTIPHDDYAPYLLKLVGHGGEIPVAPAGYRLLAVAAAIPCYYLLPPYRFTNLPKADPARLRAQQALSFTAYGFLVMGAATIYLLARRRGVTVLAATVGAIAYFLLTSHIQRMGIDPIALFWICLLVLTLESPVAFGLLVITAVGVNEKIPILLAVVLMARTLAAAAARRPLSLLPQLGLSVVAAAAYFALRAVVALPGNEQQTEATRFFAHLRATVAHSLTAKGVFLNLIPIGIMSILSALAVKSRAATGFQRADLWGVATMILLAGLADVAYNVGRIAMYACPLVLPAATQIADDLFGDAQPRLGGQRRSTG